MLCFGGGGLWRWSWCSGVVAAQQQSAFLLLAFRVSIVFPLASVLLARGELHLTAVECVFDVCVVVVLGMMQPLSLQECFIVLVVVWLVGVLLMVSSKAWVELHPGKVSRELCKLVAGGKGVSSWN